MRDGFGSYFGHHCVMNSFRHVCGYSERLKGNKEYRYGTDAENKDKDNIEQNR